VANDAGELLEIGGEALTTGDWARARSAFGEVLASEQVPEAFFGMGTVQWWQGEIREALTSWERAYGGFRRRPDLLQAALVAVNLSLVYQANVGNRVVAEGWLARATRLAGDLDAPVVDGWILIVRASLELDPQRARELAEQAHRIAVANDDLDLELCALSVWGSALIDGGRVSEGASLLDESLAGALGGEIDSLDTIIFTSCVLIQSCYRCADFSRVVQWTHALDGFIQQIGSPYVNATCRAHYGAVLMATGDWRRAEEELRRALDLSGNALPTVRAEALAYLAELRLAQGQIDEAERLIDGFEDHAVVVPVLAAIRLAAGKASVAVSTASRRLGELGAEHLEGARLREVRGQALLANGEVDAVVEDGRRLAELGSQLECSLISARGERLLGLALGQAGDRAGARPHLEAALSCFVRLEMPLEVARTRMAIAEAVHDDEPEVAVAEASAALSAFEHLGAQRDRTMTSAWLRDVGVPFRAAGDPALEVLTGREREVLELLGQGLSNPEIAEQLYISRRTVEHHVASVLSKLMLRNRAEAAGFAVRHLGVPAGPNG
jgi:DNA-binding CsgD family transcriptional regulator/tetratricopeptide (TPR) repeat protein